MAAKKVKVGNVPNLRFPGFEGEWEETLLGNLATISSGGTPSRQNTAYWNGSIPWVTTSLVNSETIFEAEELITPLGLKNSSAKLFPKGTVLMAMYGQGKTRGQVAMLGIDACTNQACAAIITKPNVLDSRFLFQDLSKRYNEIRELSNKGGQENLSGSIVKRLDIVFPSLAEQNKIASVLSVIDQRIQTQNKIIEELKLLKNTVSKKIFSGQIKFQDKNERGFPEWELKKLGDIGETYNGLTGKTKENFGTGKPYIQYKQIFDRSEIDISKCDFVSVIGNENQNRVKKGDVFFTVSSETPEEIGMSSVLLEEVGEMYLNSFCFGYRPSSIETLDPSFARYLFRSETFRNEIIKLAQGSTRYNMSKIALMKSKVYLPCIEEQTKIAEFLSALGNKIGLERSLLQQLENQKQYFLQNLFI
jgi:type I restriction enzyme S subunit